jgi:predicted phage terminase large subunit-like protein
LTDVREIEKFFNLNKKTYLYMARDDFDSYCLYLEWNREPSKRFYQPRRKALYRVAQDLQDLEDGKINLLGISMPPGVGKTTLAIFYLTWLAGRSPNQPILGGSHSNAFLRGVYDECNRIMQPNGEYLWGDVFVGSKIARTNAMDMMIDIDKPMRFSTLQFSSIGSGNAGKVRAEKLLYCDDLCSGIEEALSRERMDSLWTKYTTDFRQRKIGDCKELHIATRWSVHDVLGRLEREYDGNEKVRFTVLPALNEKGESNFDYGNHAGFTTEFYKDMQKMLDDASWRALYMNEPIEREGLLYSAGELRRYFELPKDEKGQTVEPDAIISVCDPKEKGTDYAFMPVAYVYGNDYYIEDCICDNGAIEILDERMANMLVRHRVKSCRFESNSAGWRTAEKVQTRIKELKGITHITTKRTTANKETKIIVNSAWVKEHCLFKDTTKYERGSEYWKMLNFLCSWTMAGKNKNDDIPDGMAMLAEYAQSMSGARVEICKRPF